MTYVNQYKSLAASEDWLHHWRGIYGNTVEGAAYQLKGVVEGIIHGISFRGLSEDYLMAVLELQNINEKIIVCTPLSPEAYMGNF
jgi:hypothetical protein